MGSSYINSGGTYKYVDSKEIPIKAVAVLPQYERPDRIGPYLRRASAPSTQH